MARKRILVVATGGTIASVAEGSGLAPGLTGDELVALVPLVGELCDVDVAQPMNIDSTNMRPSDWLGIARAIRETYDDYDGFVVLHGTDTMAYTAAALSYLVQGSDKPIALTGSQQPMAAPFTDAKLNVYQSLLWACDDASRDVAVVFGGEVICGTRARKQRTMSFNAFASVNFPPLAYVRGGRVVRAGAPEGSARTVGEKGAGAATAGDPAGTSGSGATGAAAGGSAATVGTTNPAGPRFYDGLDDRVVVLKLTPGLRPDVLDLLRPDCRAVVLETFGIGGVPAYDDSFRRAIFRWADSGRTVVMTTQVPEEGLDLGVYEVGRPYADREGILRGGDMTCEAIVAKTMWALAAARGDRDELARLFYLPVNHDRADG